MKGIVLAGGSGTPQGVFYGGVKVSTGGARPGQRVAVGDLL